MTVPEEQNGHPVSAAPQAVRIVDFDMPFGSMIYIMLKWTLAAIPAMVILGMVGAFLAAIFFA